MPDMPVLCSGSHELNHPLIVIVGPTASGKTDVAQIVAEAYNGAVLSADSMQIYRGMDIGTGKITPAEQRVPHFGIDICEPGDAYSVALFQEYGRGVITSLDATQTRCVVCGGTGFYVRAILDDYQFPAGEQCGNPVRDYYNAYIIEHGSLFAWEELKRRDPASAALIHPNESKRIVRAFELLSEHTSYAEQREKLSSITAYYPAYWFGLSVDADLLRKRIDARVDHMIEAGLIEEVQHLLECGLEYALTSSQAIGYKQVISYLCGNCSLADAVASIKTATHQYAKRQRTWFNRDKRICWLDANDANSMRIAQEIMKDIA